MPNPDIETLFVDHTCDQPITVSADWLCSLYYSMEMRLFYAQVCHMFHGQIFRPVPRATIPPSLLEWISNPGCVFILNALFYVFWKICFIITTSANAILSYHFTLFIWKICFEIRFIWIILFNLKPCVSCYFNGPSDSFWSYGKSNCWFWQSFEEVKAVWNLTGGTYE